MKHTTHILVAAIVAAALAWPAARVTAAAAPRQPNIVYILADDKY